MFRFRVLQVGRLGDNGAINLKIKAERYSTKNKVTKDNLTLASTETIEAKEVPTVQDSSDCATELTGNNLNCIVSKPAERSKVKLKVKQSSTLQSESKENVAPKFKIMKDLKSFPIFGDEVTEEYGIQCIKDDSCLKIPSVTNILSETMSDKAKKALEMWKNNIINTYNEEYFETFSKGLLLEGKLFHACVQNTLLKKEVPIEARIKPVYDSVEPILKDLQAVHALETYVTHPTLRYRGIVDCIASYRDQLYIIDWKKSGKPKASLAATFDAPIQLAAYIGAINASNDHPFRIDRGLVVVAYTSGEPATVHELNDSTLQKSWKEWLRRLEKFYTNLNKS